MAHSRRENVLKMRKKGVHKGTGSVGILVLAGFLTAGGTLQAGAAGIPEKKLSRNIESIETRPGVSLPFLVLGDPKGVSKTALILFPGGWGDRHLRVQEDGTVNLGKNFLVRTAPMLAAKGYRVVIVDVPSDKISGMDDDFRKSDGHAQDIGGLIKEIASRGVDTFYLLGTSRGTLSVSSLAVKLKDERIKGIALTASLEYDGFLKWLPLKEIQYPVLLVHHRYDECYNTTFYQAKKSRDVLKKTTKVDFVEVSGGRLPDSGPCQPLSPHGFYGVEEKVVEAIGLWLSGKPVPEKVE